MRRDDFFELIPIMVEISIHAPAWGATQKLGRSVVDCKFQFTRPHGARHRFTFNTRNTSAISIHAPAWGATFFVCHLQKSQSISIHAPAWGATFQNFQFTKMRQISIHAPAWGATILCNHFDMSSVISIHAPAWGATLQAGQQSILEKFQFTRPHGARL